MAWIRDHIIEQLIDIIISYKSDIQINHIITLSASILFPFQNIKQNTPKSPAL